ncbi:flagellar hook-basal body complex protein [Hyphomonas sp.]|uniref:flagellar hook-basal body complex protein n=1 Tax=Hyphomonas sp. TaxID=87 RepID=UPI0025BBB569|nr:flagellar hook-basal body complex protein [Hyphomonas sp.]
MFGSMFIGLSGMRAYSEGLRQVSNNITNLNSSGFKASDIAFTDLFGSGARGAGLSGSGGGTSQGVALTDLRLDFNQGELRQSNRSLDLAIDGAGFLVLEKGGEFSYARTGSFEVDEDGFVVLSGTDYRLTVIGASGNPEAVSIAPYRTNPPSATTSIKFADNLSSTATEFSLADISVFDALGKSDNWKVSFSRAETDPAGEWKVSVKNGGGTEIATHTLKFTNGVIDSATAKVSVSNDGRTAELDFSENVTSFSSGSISTLRTAIRNGNGVGDIVNIAVNDTGVLEISYSNEQKKSLGAVTLADFRDPQALEQKSGGLFAYAGLGGRDFFASENGRVGRVLSSRSEASNVDLSAQFGDLILVQRGYQASSQIVSVSNEMIQQLFGLRGQG